LIIIDTNVISEPTRPNPDARVVAWLNRQNVGDCYLTTISIAEIYRGIELLPNGKRKSNLKSKTDESLELLFENRILPFDLAAAHAFASLAAKAKKGGNNISMADAQIASIATAHGFSVATRDVVPFVAAGCRVVNPWETSLDF
jgi:toxin FitB